SVGIRMKGNKPFGCQVSFDIVDRSAQQLRKAFAVRLERHAAMDVHFQVRPYLMDIRYAIIRDDLLHEDLYPCGDTHDNADIPVDGFTRDLVQLRIPVARSCNLFPRLIKMLKPKGQACRLYAAQVALEIAAAMVEVGTPAQHKNSRFEKVCRHVVFRKRKDLAYARLLNRLGHVLRHGYVL